MIVFRLSTANHLTTELFFIINKTIQILYFRLNFNINPLCWLYLKKTAERLKRDGKNYLKEYCLLKIRLFK